MKTFKTIFALLLITLFAFSCTPNSINDDSAQQETETFATGGDGQTSTDDDREGGN